MEPTTKATAAPCANPPSLPHRHCYLLISLAHLCLAVIATLDPSYLIAASEALICGTYFYLADRIAT